MTNNGYVSVEDKKALWLDQALLNQSPEVKARVLDFAVRFGVDSGDDDFWVLIAAVGYLNTIVEDAPMQWDRILANHTQDLNLWTESNLKLIEGLALQAETNAEQAQLTQELSNTLRALTKLLRSQQQHIAKLQQTLASSETNLNKSNKSLNTRLTEVSNYQIQNTRDLQRVLSLLQTQQAKKPVKNQRDKLLAIGTFVLALIAVCILLF